MAATRPMLCNVGRRFVTTYALAPRSIHFNENQQSFHCCRRHYCIQHIHYNPFDPSLLKLPLARYGNRQTVTALAGDGIGPEMLQHVRDLFELAHVPVDFEEVQLDSSVSLEDTASLENAIISIERNGVALKGNIETKYHDPTAKSRNVELRVRLDLYANVLRCKATEGVPCKHPELDIIMMRENTEGEYSGIEHEVIPGVVESLKVVTRHNIERIARFAFDYATKFGRKKITAIHKANIQKIGDGLFLRVCEDMAKNYPEIKFDNMIIDNASMQLVAKPQQFDIVLMPNLYGNILSNIACGLVGGPGLISGMNLGDKYAVFETGTRNTGTSMVGKNAANPVAFLRAGVDMLFYLGMDKEAKLIKDSINKVLTIDRIHTSDLGGSATTSEFVAAVNRNILAKMEVAL